MYRYQNNAFRVLGLMPSATHSEVMRRANEIKVKKSLGVDIAYEYDFSWMGDMDRSEENVIHAMQRLEDPIFRFKEELTWFWIYSDTDKKGLALLVNNKRKDAHDVWNELINYSSASDIEKCSAYFNQAILAHSSVIGREALIKYSDKDNETARITLKEKGAPTCPKCQKTYDGSWKVCPHCGVPLTDGYKDIVIKSKKRNILLDDSHWKNWKFAWNRFLYVVHQEYFLGSIREKVKRISDPRLSEDRAKEICTHFLPSILDPNLAYIAQALTAKDYERVQKHSSILNGLNLNLGPLFDQQRIGATILTTGFNKVLSYHIRSLNASVDTLQNDLSVIKDQENKHAFIKLYDSFSSKADTLLYEANLVDINNTSDFLFSRDNASKALRSISIDIHNKFNDYSKSYEIIQKALTYAGSAYQKQQCENDANTVKKHLDNSRASVASTESATSPNVFKQIPWWVWVGGFWLLVTILSNTNTTTTQTSSRVASPSYSPTYHSSPEDSMSLSDLKTKIEDLRATLTQQEKRLTELREAAEQKESELSSLKTEIEGLENRYKNSSYVPEYVTSNYAQKVQEYNSLVPIHNSFITQAKNMYSDYEKNLSECNRLIAVYNRRAKY